MQIPADSLHRALGAPWSITTVVPAPVDIRPRLSGPVDRVLPRSARSGSPPPRPNHFSWGDVTDLRQLASIDPSIEGGASQGLGWGVSAPTPWRSTRSGTAANVSVQRLAHNGALVGTAAWVVHQAIFGYAAIGAPPIDYTDTLSLGLAFNRDNVVEQADIDALLAIAQAVELDDGWPSGDLFDEV